METTTLSTAVDESTAPVSAPILVATDGTRQSDGALAVARALAESLGTDVQVLTVQSSLNLIVPDASLLLAPSAITKLNAELMQRVRKQCADVSAAGSGPALMNPEVETGQPERAISRVASDRGVQLVVVGIGRHDIADRIFGSETALKVAQLSRAPILAVPAESRAAPRRAIVAVDFSEASLRAAQDAVHLLGAREGTLHLVHVVPRERALLDPWMSESKYAELIRHRFVRFRARLAVPPNVTVDEETRTGDAARELIACAGEERAELIAAGSHGHGFVTRVVLGSVTTALLRAANCAVLVVPPSALPIRGSSAVDRDRCVRVDSSQWAAVLNDFTRTNAGRRTQLEVDDPEIGAQAQEHDYPLRGVAFDVHDQRVEIMLGRDRGGEPHLSRSIGGVTSLDVLTDKDGRDVALRLRHGAGQTVLTFVP
ncbi:MAG TPA: universal stress protein [Gemmatimonadaceae bacterium]|jgi:nucleotide-binding universal stress UspA family protein